MFSFNHEFPLTWQILRKQKKQPEIDNFPILSSAHWWNVAATQKIEISQPYLFIYLFFQEKSRWRWKSHPGNYFYELLFFCLSWSNIENLIKRVASLWNKGLLKCPRLLQIWWLNLNIIINISSFNEALTLMLLWSEFEYRNPILHRGPDSWLNLSTSTIRCKHIVRWLYLSRMKNGCFFG